MPRDRTSRTHVLELMQKYNVPEPYLREAMDNLEALFAIGDTGFYPFAEASSFENPLIIIENFCALYQEELVDLAFVKVADAREAIGQVGIQTPTLMTILCTDQIMKAMGARRFLAYQKVLESSLFRPVWWALYWRMKKEPTDPSIPTEVLMKSIISIVVSYIGAILTKNEPLVQNLTLSVVLLPVAIPLGRKVNTDHTYLLVTA